MKQDRVMFFLNQQSIIHRLVAMGSAGHLSFSLSSVCDGDDKCGVIFSMWPAGAESLLMTQPLVTLSQPN